MRVVFLPEVEDYLVELSELLHQKEYFGFKENAVKYITELVLEIKTSLHKRIKKDAPPYFDRYGKGMKYVTFKKNKTTQWYVFFSIYEINNEFVYLVRYVSNNHIASHHL
ncbi:hypothetical protein [Plebeiibacterium sediminum]|uniref:Uncharacterized protein n=1 Tax=Plebeiibacterium sediminum TaxID=2992112 RepID=A0AAE3M9M3_9BACT|nr:hypothetical protein [Plebeiobacterium sediminum]MCW3789546.1 hypothetical protein [Plebeiobacterium sediminum]